MSLKIDNFVIANKELGNVAQNAVGIIRAKWGICYGFIYRDKRNQKSRV